jgi:hypothetical protein
MKPAPQELVQRIEELVPQGSEVISLGWAYEDEDHNIAVFIDDEEDARRAEKHLLDAVSDYDETHGTFTLCLVWHKRDKALPGWDMRFLTDF